VGGIQTVGCAGSQLAGSVGCGTLVGTGGFVGAGAGPFVGAGTVVGCGSDGDGPVLTDCAHSPQPGLPLQFQEQFLMPDIRGEGGDDSVTLPDQFGIDECAVFQIHIS